MRKPQSMDPADRMVADYISRRIARGNGRNSTGDLNGSLDSGIDTIRLYQLLSDGGTGGGSTPVYPFDVSFSGSGTLTVTVVPGAINGLLPTNILSTLSIGATATGYLVLSATVSAGQIASCVLSIASSPSAAIPVNMGQPPTAFDFLIGVIVNGVWFRTIGPGGLAATASEAYRVSKLTPSPGTLPYDIWYTWDITEA